MYEKYRKWRSEDLREENGIVVAADLTQEWLLPWWWKRYSHTNQYPVSFVNFGLTEEAKKWCRERGELVSLPVPDLFVKDKDEIQPDLIQRWESESGSHFWPSRKTWFKKPLACLRSPFLKSIWIDLDCEIRGSLQPLFECAEHPSGIALMPSSVGIYNAGVIVFKRDVPLFEQWADGAFERNGEFRGDQELLSQLIAENNLSVYELPPVYNWDHCSGDKPEALIYHWHGRFGKCVIQHQISLEETFFSF